MVLGRLLGFNLSCAAFGAGMLILSCCPAGAQPGCTQDGRHYCLSVPSSGGNAGSRDQQNAVAEANRERAAAENKRYNDTWDAAKAAEAAGNLEQALLYYQQAYGLRKGKYGLYNINRLEGNIANQNGYYSLAIAHYEAARKACKECLTEEVIQKYRQQAAAREEALTALQKNATAVADAHKTVNNEKASINDRLAQFANAGPAWRNGCGGPGQAICIATKAPSPGLAEQKQVIGPLSTSAAFGIRSNPDDPRLTPADHVVPGTDTKATDQTRSASATSMAGAGAGNLEIGSVNAGKTFDQGGGKPTEGPALDLGNQQSPLAQLPPDIRAKVLKDANYSRLENEKATAQTQWGEAQKKLDVLNQQAAAATDPKTKSDIQIQIANQTQVRDQAFGAVNADDAKQQEIIRSYGTPIIVDGPIQQQSRGIDHIEVPAPK